ncbi:MacB-like core domain-containing protein [Clostridium amylolyticum]|uniref:MacB-like core domain-containing protein n=1 Tax=Clostridium amylolyticum TaxID=1121298 RepID=A0A1M6N6Z3_9CLOT|nr:ABC transporter permease [Clostridium amylolyticum]SHJ91316.1 MacB-like core domain-containing protein [Clostridium amylolyticum]
MRTIYRNIKNSTGLVIIFTTIFIFFTLVATVILSQRQFNKNIDSFLSQDYKEIYIRELNPENIKLIFNELSNNKGTIILSNDVYNEDLKLTAKWVYFNDKLFGTPPKIKSGRFFNIEDFKSNNPVAVIGESYLEETYEEKEEKYINFKGISFKVIGVFKSGKGYFDNSLMLNFNALADNKLSVNNMQYDNYNGSVIQDLNSLKSSFENSDTGKLFSIESPMMNTSDHLSGVLKQYKSLIDKFMLMLAALILNTILASFFWIQKKTKEIGVRRIYGASNIKMVFSIIKDYLSVVFFSTILTVIINLGLKSYISNMDLINVAMDKDYLIIITLLLIVFASILGLIFAIISTLGILKREPSEIIRER